MGKTICDWTRKDFEKHPEKLQALTKNACFYCQKCGRVANTKKALCKAEAFSETSESIKCLEFAA